MRPGPQVELVDVGATDRQHHHLLRRGARPVAGAGGPPGGGQGAAGVRAGVGPLHPASRVVSVQGLARVAVAQLVEGAAFPGLDLSPVLLQLVGVQGRGQGAERSAGGQFRELVVVAD